MIRVSEVITTDQIKQWNKGDIITITAGTGVGKSYFIKNILYAFAKKENKKILMLIHRINCIKQFQIEVTKDNKSDVIELKTYQSIENQEIDFSNYEYIICDEFHYFMGDASYNITSDISLNKILNQNEKTRIFMSATGDSVKRYINNYKKITTIDYEIPIEYKFIDNLSFFNKPETIENFIQECIEKNDKGIFFIQSAKVAYELYKKYKDNCIFNCSRSNKKYYKYVDEDIINSILENQRFEKNILITTSCMDAGVNIIDTELKHIVCDIKDIGVLIQCMGRKRQQYEGDKTNVYIKSITNNQLGGMKTQLLRKIEKAEFLKDHTLKEYIQKYPRQNDYNNIVYDIETDEENKGQKKINELMYFKNLFDIALIDSMLFLKKYGYNKYIKELFSMSEDKIIYIDEDYKQSALEKYLDSIVGKVFLQSKDRIELIEKINVRRGGKLLKKLNNLNGALEEENIPYRIIEFSTSRIVNDKKKNYKSAWRVYKLSSDK